MTSQKRYLLLLHGISQYLFDQKGRLYQVSQNLIAILFIHIIEYSFSSRFLRFISPVPQNSLQSFLQAPQIQYSYPAIPHEYRAALPQNQNPHLPLQEPHQHSAPGQAPVIRFKLLSIHKLNKTLHIPELCLREALLQPVRLFVEIMHLLELLDGIFSRFIKRLFTAACFAAYPVFTSFCLQLIFTYFDKPTHQLE